MRITILIILLLIMLVFVFGWSNLDLFRRKENYVSRQITTIKEKQGTIYLKWKFVTKVVDNPPYDKQPLTTVTLVLSGAQNKEVVIDTFTGDGFDTRQSKWDNPPGAIISAMFWWGGSGDEISVYRTAADQLTVRHRWIDEQSGWGPFTDIKKITIPFSANTVPSPIDSKEQL